VNSMTLSHLMDILSVQRIPNNKPKKVVLLQHGLGDSSMTWVMNYYPNQDLGFILADNGYDVWLSNSRGNVYSNRHVTLKPTDEKYWDFTWDEHASIDLPTEINYITKITGVSKIVYIGHSQGGMIGLAQFSRPETANKIDRFVAVAPASYLKHVGTPFLSAVAKVPESVVYGLFGHKGFVPNSEIVKKVIPEFCRLNPKLCDNFVCVLCGCEFLENINSSRQEVIFSHFPAGTSVKNILHYAQAVNNDKFQMFDYGTSGNLKHYNQTTPPKYDLSKLLTRNAIIYGSGDKLVNPTDTKRAIAEMPTPEVVMEIPKYGHGDFVWGLDATDKLYNFILSYIQKP